jgi:hypothetical protein
LIFNNRAEPVQRNAIKKQHKNQIVNVFFSPRRRELERTPFESHARTAIKVFTYSLVTALVVGGVCVPMLMKFPLFATLAGTHAIDVGVVMFMLGLLLVWLPGWGIVGLMRALKEEPFGS